MTKLQYEKLKRAIQNRFDLGVSELEAIKVTEHEALDKVYQMMDTLKTHGVTYGSITKNVIKVIEDKKVPDVFTKNDIIRAFGCLVSYNSLDGCLRRLAARRFITVVEKGKGSLPTKYSLTP